MLTRLYPASDQHAAGDALSRVHAVLDVLGEAAVADVAYRALTRSTRAFDAFVGTRPSSGRETTRSVSAVFSSRHARLFSLALRAPGPSRWTWGADARVPHTGHASLSFCRTRRSVAPGAIVSVARHLADNGLPSTVGAIGGRVPCSCPRPSQRVRVCGSPASRYRDIAATNVFCTGTSCDKWVGMTRPHDLVGGITLSSPDADLPSMNSATCDRENLTANRIHLTFFV